MTDPLLVLSIVVLILGQASEGVEGRKAERINPTAAPTAAPPEFSFSSSDSESTTELSPPTPAPTPAPDGASWSSSGSEEDPVVTPQPDGASWSASSTSETSSWTPAPTAAPPTPQPPEATLPPVPSNGILVAINGSTLLQWLRANLPEATANTIPADQTLVDDYVMRMPQVQTTLGDVLGPFLMLSYVLEQKKTLLTMSATQLGDIVKSGSLANTPAGSASMGYTLTLKFNVTQAPSAYPWGAQVLLITVFNRTNDGEEVASPKGAESLRAAINAPSSSPKTLHKLGILSAALESTAFPSPTRKSSSGVPTKKTDWVNRYGAPNEELNTMAKSAGGVKLWVFLVVLLCSSLISAVLGLVISKFVFKPSEQQSVRSRVIEGGALDVPQAADDDTGKAYLKQQQSTTFDPSSSPLRPIQQQGAYRHGAGDGGDDLESALL